MDEKNDQQDADIAELQAGMANLNILGAQLMAKDAELEEADAELLAMIQDAINQINQLGALLTARISAAEGNIEVLFQNYADLAANIAAVAFTVDEHSTQLASVQVTITNILAVIDLLEAQDQANADEIDGLANLLALANARITALELGELDEFKWLGRLNGPSHPANPTIGSVYYSKWHHETYIYTATGWERMTS
jgi:seryl-tRNA synthetase